MIKNAQLQKVEPIIYLHPHEFGNSMKFFVNWYDLSKLDFLKKIYWYLRQYQWLKIGNKGLEKKVNHLILKEGLSGRLQDLIKNEIHH